MNFDNEVQSEQAALIHHNAPIGIIGGYVVACILASACWNAINPVYLGAWLAAGAMLSIWRLVIWRSFRDLEFSLPVARRWLHLAMLGAALSGCLWGGSVFIFFSTDEFLYQLLYVFAAAMMGTTAMFSFSAHYPTFMAFFMPTNVSSVLGLLAQGSWLHFQIALGAVIFMVVTLYFFANYHRMFLKSLHLRFENTVLVDQLTVQKEAAESANLAKSRFLAAASHDLRQPMHALTLYLDALENHDIQGVARTNLANARQCAQTMDEMFRALLDISRLDAGAVKADIQVFSMEPLLERLRMEFEPQAQAKGLVFKVRSCKRSVLSDPALIERILRNFVANAIRYTERGRILVGCRQQGENLRVAVYDTGLGIASDEQGKIFEEFYQLGNPERDRAKGIGLGLAIVSRLVALLGTSVSVVSRVGEGSMFAVDLLREDGSAQARVVASPQPAVRIDMKGLFIVVVDDEEPILAATREILEQWQCTVLTATSGATALEQLAASQRAPDALICDYRLRNHETGIDVIESLRAEFNVDIPTIIASGDSAPARMREAEANGLRVLHKPFNEQSLRLALTKVLASHESQSA